MKASKKIFTLIFLAFEAVLGGTSLFAGIKFGDGDINSRNQLLFTLKHSIPGTEGYRTLFKADLQNGTAEVRPEILTCYPEHMELIKGESVLQVRNRYGIVWYDIKKDSFSWKETVPEVPSNSMRIAPYAVSPDGKWNCHVEKNSYATGILYLENMVTGKKVVLNENAPFSYRTVPAKWQNDSSIVVYEKDGFIYFCNPEALLKGVEAAEEYRKIGSGTMNSVCWSGGKYLIYIDCDMVYRINSKELYTLGLYSGIIGKGTTIGRLPFLFSPAKDKFSVNEDITNLVVIQKEKNYTLYKVSGKATCDYFSVVSSRHFIDNKHALLEAEVIWASNSEPAIWIKTMPYSSEKPSASVYKMNEKFQKLLEIENSGLPCISPDKTLASFYSGSTIYVYSTASWKRISSFTAENIESLVFDSNNMLYAGGDRTIKKWNLNDNSKKVIMLSSATNGYWDIDGSLVADNGNGKSYIYNQEARNWTESSAEIRHTNVMRNEDYRVFCGQTPNKNYENALYIRSLKGKAVTKPVLEESTRPTEERRKIALSFDAYDNADGIAGIIYDLDTYNVPGTFFLNGEFIRRYPNECNLLANSKNDCASMFFSTARLISGDYIMDEEFIRRGLARNEDEFFQCTGRELSLLWHAPYYKKIEKAIQVGKDAGYTYVDALSSCLDTVTLEDAVRGKAEYLSPEQIINIYMQGVRSGKGNILSVAAGISYGERESYLYETLDLLLSALLDEGYDVVLVRDVIGK